MRVPKFGECLLFILWILHTVDGEYLWFVWLTFLWVSAKSIMVFLLHLNYEKYKPNWTFLISFLFSVCPHNSLKPHTDIETYFIYEIASLFNTENEEEWNLNCKAITSMVYLKIVIEWLCFMLHNLSNQFPLEEYNKESSYRFISIVSFDACFIC